MARIAATEIPNEKRVVIALTYIYGIGVSLSKEILKKTKISEDTKVKDLTEDELAKIRAEITNNKDIVVEGDLRRAVQLDIKRLKDIGSYRGIRHRKGLPVRGQGTKQNARTRKGKRKTVANKKKS